MTREQATTILRRLRVPITEATFRAAISSGYGDTVEAINVLGYGGALAALAVDESLGTRPPVESPTIVVERVAQPSGAGWAAYLASNPTMAWGLGESRCEAIGDLIGSHPTTFGVVVDIRE